MNEVPIGGYGGDMKRKFVVVILMLMLAACGSPTVRPPTPTPTSIPDAYSTVSGKIVRNGTGQPYPNAYVRFGWLVSAYYEKEIHTVTDGRGMYAIRLPAGQFQVTAVDTCDLNAGFAIVGRARDDVMITIPGTTQVNFVEYPITPGADLAGVC